MSALAGAASAADFNPSVDRDALDRTLLHFSLSARLVARNAERGWRLLVERSPRSVKWLDIVSRAGPEHAAVAMQLSPEHGTEWARIAQASVDVVSHLLSDDRSIAVAGFDFAQDNADERNNLHGHAVAAYDESCRAARAQCHSGRRAMAAARALAALTAAIASAPTARSYGSFACSSLGGSPETANIASAAANAVALVECVNTGFVPSLTTPDAPFEPLLRMARRHTDTPLEAIANAWVQRAGSMHAA